MGKKLTRYLIDLNFDLITVKRDIQIWLPNTNPAEMAKLRNTCHLGQTAKRNGLQPMLFVIKN